MADRSLRTLLSGLLVLAFVLFGLGQGAEIFHSLEEEGHLPHHGHAGTVFHQPLPCDSGEHPPHVCLHSQQSTAALHFRQAFIQETLEPAPRIHAGSIRGHSFRLRAIRAPPSLPSQHS